MDGTVRIQKMSSSPNRKICTFSHLYKSQLRILRLMCLDWSAYKCQGSLKWPLQEERKRDLKENGEQNKGEVKEDWGKTRGNKALTG